MKTTDRIKCEISPINFYETELSLNLGTKAGWVVAGKCPFHDDKRAGSFCVDTKSGSFKCHSCDSKGGDIIAFKQLRTGMKFLEVLDVICTDWGVAR